MSEMLTRREFFTKPAKEYVQTSVETALLAVGELMFVKAAHEAGIRIGGRGVSREEINQLASLDLNRVLLSCLVYPMNETVLFQFFPSLEIDQTDKTKPLHERGKLHMGVGAVSSLLFAAMHNFAQSKPGSASPITLKTDSLPLPQFANGLFFWYLTRKRGVSHALLSHMEMNSIDTAFLAIGARTGRTRR
jgi:hypothetical protein